MVAWLAGAHGVERVEVAGSFRRLRETATCDVLASRPLPKMHRQPGSPACPATGCAGCGATAA